MKNFIKDLFHKEPLGIYDESLQASTTAHLDRDFIIQGPITNIDRDDNSDPNSDYNTISVMDTLTGSDIEYPNMTISYSLNSSPLDVGEIVRITGSLFEHDHIYNEVYHVMELEHVITSSVPPLLITDNDFRQEELDSLPENAFIFDGPVKEVYRTKDVFEDIVQLLMYDRHSKRDYYIDTSFPAPENISVGNVIRAQGEKEDSDNGTAYVGDIFFRWPK